MTSRVQNDFLEAVIPLYVDERQIAQLKYKRTEER
jgi:hypothetical protein